ncbi:Uncharacterised protein [Mycobacteroides abscessus]|nr:Uncharacterised protein [Mycobacteroides abscessus]
MPDVVVALATERLTDTAFAMIMDGAAPQRFSMRAAAIATDAVMIPTHAALAVATACGRMNGPVAGGGKGEEHLRPVGHVMGMP